MSHLRAHQERHARGSQGVAGDGRRGDSLGRRGPLLLWLALAFFVFVADARPEKKNVLYIIVDDLTADLALFGGKIDQVPTPNLDGRLAPRSLNFQRAYAQQALCGPSRNSFLSGRHPDELQVYTFMRSFRDALPDAVSLPQAFKRSGYLTCGFGKVFHDDAVKSPPDYDEPYSWSPECPFYAPKEDRCGPGKHGWCNPDKPDEEFTDGQGVAKAIERLRAHAASNLQQQQQQRPFFFAVGLRKPHMDWAVPQAYLDAQVPQSEIRLPAAPVRVAPPGMPPCAWWNCTQEGTWAHSMPELVLYPDRPLDDDLEQELRRAYYSAVTFMDSLVGKFLDALEELGLVEDTVIAFHSDHGFHLSEEGMYCKQNTREIGVRVPLLLSVPGVTTNAPQTTDTIVQLVDVYPTLLDLAGLALPPDASLPGKSLAPLLQSRPQPLESKEAAAAAFSQFPRCLSTAAAPSGLADQGYAWNRQCVLLGNNLIDVMGYSVRVDGWRYNEWYKFDSVRWLPLWNKEGLVARELYVMDAGGKDEAAVTPNVVDAGEYAEVADRLAQVLLDHFGALQAEAVMVGDSQRGEVA